MFVGNTPQINRIRKKVECIALEQSPEDTVLILGETGSGKEELARWIHASTDATKNALFVSFNGAQFRPELAASALFGHRKGAFTGADADHDGLFHQAQGGTLFLDEIGELPNEIQSLLLRALENFEIQPLGSSKTEPVRVKRFIFATNKPLIRLMQEGKFREDLFYRINHFILELPPLRKRKDDIPLLVDYFLKAREPSGTTRLSPEALEAIKQHSWPGNVRELKSVMIRCVTFHKGKVVSLDEIRECFTENQADNRNFTDLSLHEYRRRQMNQLEYEYFKGLISQYGRKTKTLAEKAGLSTRSIQLMLKKHQL